MKNNRKRDSLYIDLGDVYAFIKEKPRSIYEIRDHFRGRFTERWLTSAVAQLRQKKLARYNGRPGRFSDGRWEAIEKLESGKRFVY